MNKKMTVKPVTPKSSQEEWDEWFDKFNNIPDNLPEREQPCEQEEREEFMISNNAYIRE
jgi:hypothetical protein